MEKGGIWKRGEGGKGGDITSQRGVKRLLLRKGKQGSRGDEIKRGNKRAAA